MNVGRRGALQLSMGLAGAVLSGCSASGSTAAGASVSVDAKGNRRSLRILATSDIHGWMQPYNYGVGERDTQGSMSQVASVIKKLRRDEDTILIDAGDLIQDNMAELFVRESPDEVHPMVQCMNELHYDVCVLGDHEFDFGLDVARKTARDLEATVLVGNVVDEDGQPLAEGYTIIERRGVRVGIIGMTTSNIKRFNPEGLKGCKVSNPLTEMRKIIKQIEDSVDALIAVCHFGMDRELGQRGTSARIIAQKCPELDLIIAAHDHELIEGEEVNGVPIVQNEAFGRTVMNIEMEFEHYSENWRCVSVKSEPVFCEYYSLTPDIDELVASYDERARAYASEKIAVLSDGPLAPRGSFAGCPATVTRGTALVDKICAAQKHISGADVVATSLDNPMSNISPGDVNRAHVAKLFAQSRRLCTFKMTGAQLRKYMNWSARIFKTWEEGDLTIAFDPQIPSDHFDVFVGLSYRLDISRPVGDRVRYVRFKGKMLKNADELVVAVNSERAKRQILVPGVIFDKDDMPKLLKANVLGELTDTREMLVDYFQNVRAGSISNNRFKNWAITGTKWDAALHKRAMQQLASGSIKLWEDDGQNHLIDEAVKKGDLVQTKDKA